MHNKRGQFYLIAAVIIIGLVIGFIGIQNITHSTQSTKVNDIQEELSLERRALFSYVIQEGDSSLLEAYAETYQTFIGGSATVYYITGTEDEKEAYFFEDGNKQTIPIIDNSISIAEQSFTLPSHKGLYFEYIIIQDLGKERYITTSF